MADDRELEAAIASGKVPGAVTLVTDSENTLYSRAFGHSDAVAGTPMREDTVFQIASMTKAITTTAALQLVEQGRLSLDAPIGDVLPELAEPRVFAGWGEAGAIQTRPAARPITLRHLLTHTSGLGYSFMNADLLRHAAASGHAPNSRASFNLPLLFDPGERWEYGVGTDWTGLAVEAVSGQRLGDYLAEHVTGPLGMRATRFRPAAEMPEDAAKIHARLPDGGFAHVPMVLGEGEVQSGGGGLSSTAHDYARFLRMILRGGELEGARILTPETVAMMGRNDMPPQIRAGLMTTAFPDMAPEYDALPDQHTGWTVGGFLWNPEPGPAGRSPGSLHWAGIFNCYYWIDPTRDRAGLIMAQVSPFADSGVLGAFAALERMGTAM